MVPTGGGLSGSLPISGKPGVDDMFRNGGNCCAKSLGGHYSHLIMKAELGCASLKRVQSCHVIPVTL